jgi:hypothetical protein
MICEVFCCPDAAKHSLQSKVEVRDSVRQKTLKK